MAVSGAWQATRIPHAQTMPAFRYVFRFRVLFPLPGFFSPVLWMFMAIGFRGNVLDSNLPGIVPRFNG